MSAKVSEYLLGQPYGADVPVCFMLWLFSYWLRLRLLCGYAQANNAQF